MAGSIDELAKQLASIAEINGNTSEDARNLVSFKGLAKKLDTAADGEC